MQALGGRESGREDDLSVLAGQSCQASLDILPQHALHPLPDQDLQSHLQANKLGVQVQSCPVPIKRNVFQKLKRRLKGARAVSLAAVGGAGTEELVQTSGLAWLALHHCPIAFHKEFKQTLLGAKQADLQ